MTMKAAPSILWSVIFCVGLARNLVAAPEDVDHLIPVTREELEPTLQRLLERKLFLSSANDGRIIVMPPGIHGEYSVAIHSDPASSTGTTITYTEAARNISAPVVADLVQGISPKDERGVLVRRLNVPIENSIAAGVSSVLRQSVGRAHPLPKIGWIATDIVLDGTSYWFLANGRSSKPMQGLLGPTMKGRYTDGLRRLTQHLVDYCLAKADGRTEMSTKIRNDVAQLRRIGRTN